MARGTHHPAVAVLRAGDPKPVGAGTRAAASTKAARQYHRDGSRRAQRLRPIEQLFDTSAMLSVHEIENMRRSCAMSPLSLDDQRRLLDACADYERRRTAIAAVLADLPPSVAAVGAALNDLQRLVGK